jgi:hypothetical protein
MKNGVRQISKQQDYFDGNKDKTQARDETPRRRETVIPVGSEAINILAE